MLRINEITTETTKRLYMKTYRLFSLIRHSYFNLTSHCFEDKGNFWFFTVKIVEIF